jgi:hypothetical protein
MGGREDFERWARGDADPVLGVDPFVLGWGGWLTSAATSEEQALALSVLEAEAEHRAAEWDALDTYLAAVAPGGKVVIPDDLAEWERWASAVVRLGWNRPAPPDESDVGEDEGRSA